MSLELSKLRPVPPWFRNLKKLPLIGENTFSLGGRALLVGLGVDGTQVLSLIAKQLDLQGNGVGWWRNDLLLVSIGVERVEKKSIEQLHPSITTVNLEPNIPYLRKTDPYKKTDDLYAQWWHDLGQPTAGRGLARAAFFSALKDGIENSPLTIPLIKIPKQKDIDVSFVFTSLSDPVGTAIMWDVLHLLSRRDGKYGGSALSALWLAVAGESRDDTQGGNAWYELQRLSNGGNIQAMFNANDARFNRGYIQSGASHTILVGSPTETAERLEDAKNSLNALANTILWSLDASFFDNFHENRNFLLGRSSREKLNANLTSIGVTDFYQPIEVIESISAWRLADALLWGGVSKDIAGIFDKKEFDDVKIKQSIPPFLRGIKSYRVFFGALADTFTAPSRRLNMPALSQVEIPELIDAYKEELIYQLDFLLNGETDKLQSNALRFFYEGHLYLAYKFVEYLYAGIQQASSSNEYIRQVLSLLTTFTKNVYDDLDVWVKTLSSNQSSGLRAVIYEKIHAARHSLKEAYKNEHSYQVLLNSNFSPDNLEKHKYKDWAKYLLDKEVPGGNDPLSLILSRVGWLFSVDYINNALNMDFCVVDEETKVAEKKAFSANETTRIAEALYAVIRLFTRDIFENESVGTALSLQFKGQKREFVRFASEKSKPYMGYEPYAHSVHILGKDKDALDFAYSGFIEQLGQKSERHHSDKSYSAKIGILSIRNEIDVEQLFSKKPLVKKPREYVFASEKIFDEFARKVYRYSEKLDRNFTYLLSDPTLANLFGKGLLAGHISFSPSEFIFKFEGKSYPLGIKGGRLLFYRDAPLLAAMEDFVLTMPADENYNRNPLHPRNRVKVIDRLERSLTTMRNDDDYKKRLAEKFTVLKDEYMNHADYMSLSETFFLWLATIKDELREEVLNY